MVKRHGRFIALILSVLMIVSQLSVVSFAEDAGESGTAGDERAKGSYHWIVSVDGSDATRDYGYHSGEEEFLLKDFYSDAFGGVPGSLANDNLIKKGSSISYFGVNGTKHVVAKKPGKTTVEYKGETDKTLVFEIYEVVEPKPCEGLVYDGKKHSLVETDIQGMTFCLKEDGSYKNVVPSATEAGSYNVYYKVPEYYETNADGYVEVIISKAQCDAPDLTGLELLYDGKEQALVDKDEAVSEFGDVVFDANSSGYFTDIIPIGKDAKDYTISYKVICPEEGNYEDSEVKTITSSIVYPRPEAETDLVYNGYNQELIGNLDQLQVEGLEFKYNIRAQEETVWEYPNLQTHDSIQKTDANEYDVYYRLYLNGVKTDYDGHIYPVINKADADVEVEANDWVYGEDPIEPTVTRNEEVIGSDAYALTYSTNRRFTNETAEQPTDAGRYFVKATVASDGNYNEGFGIDEFRIRRANLDSAAVSIDDWTFGSDACTPQLEGLPDGLNPDVTYEYKQKDAEDDTYDTEVPTKAGEYTVRATISRTTNYFGAVVTKEFTINKAEYTPSVTIDGWTYGEEANDPEADGIKAQRYPEFTYYLSDGTTLTTSENSGAEYEGGVPVNAGTYCLKMTVPEAKNYKAAEAETGFTISPAAVTVTAGDATIYSGDEPKDPEYTIAPELVEGDSLEVTFEHAYKKGDEPGAYDIIPIVAENPNYTVTCVNGTLTVEAKPAPSPDGGGGGSVTDPVQQVVDKINALPVPVTEKDAAAVKDARDAYDKLTDEQKKDSRLTDEVMKKLTDAEEAIKSEEQKAADQAAAKAFDDVIAGLPADVNEWTREQLNAALAAYNNLTDAQKALVDSTALAKMQTAEFNYASADAKVKKVKLKSAKAMKGKKAQAKWTKNTKVTGYQLVYSTSKKFTKKTTKKVTVKSYKTVKKTVKKLKKGKTYYFKVRPYTNVYSAVTMSTVKVYGKWSNVKKCKAKK